MLKHFYKGSKVSLWLYVQIACFLTQWVKLFLFYCIWECTNMEIMADKTIMFMSVWYSINADIINLYYKNL